MAKTAVGDTLASKVQAEGIMRACRRETPPPNPRPQGAGEWIESLHGGVRIFALSLGIAAPIQTPSVLRYFRPSAAR
jgi:hypothetical protein